MKQDEQAKTAPQERTIEETAKKMQESLAETGRIKTEDVRRVLGDPRIGVVQAVLPVYAESLARAKLLVAAR